MTKYVLNDNNDCDCIWWNEDTYDSYEDAKREATDQYQRACKGEQTDLFEAGTKDTVPDCCYIGEKYPDCDWMDCDWDLDDVDNPTRDEINDLTEVMTDAFAGWCKKHGYYTNIYNVINIEELHVGDEA